MGAALVSAEALPSVPQDEYELVGRLYPESAWMFVWGRRLLRDMVGGGVSRFLVGRLGPGCWSVLHTDSAWIALRCADGAMPARPVHAVACDSAREAVAHAAAGMIVDAGVAIDSHLLWDLGFVEPARDPSSVPLVWKPTEQARKLDSSSRDDGRARYGTDGFALELLRGRPARFCVLPPGPMPDDGLFLNRHELFMSLSHSRLPGDFAVSSGEELPAGKLLEGYGSPERPYLFSLRTPFERQGLPQTAGGHEWHIYLTRRPLWTFPGFPVEETTVPAAGMTRTTGPSTGGQGYLFRDSVSSLLRSGEIIEVSRWEGTRLLKEGRAQR
ncbi:hypothetical protein [Actinomadura algeriensis]|uniref:Uncharacterized protein n=1 Tax=Actinomadura algeriensis TaxID=1679523 RepID=A0ABR9JSK7_9ACTN|nr:hypothetical protein [Actinomadura algeriensis]MBE1533358.1 hypothetical protein [Actinomadura algeriensis]